MKTIKHDAGTTTDPDIKPNNEPPVILVEVRGGLVQDVSIKGKLPGPVRFLVRDFDNLAVDPEAGDDEWLLGGQ